MHVFKNRYVMMVAMIATVLSLVSCSRAFIIKPTGRIDQSVTFYFYESPNADQPSKFNIVELVVQEQKSDKEWITVWELNGERSLEAITYGGKYEGLVERAPAKSLSPKANYRVLAKDRPRFDPVGYSAVFFSFDESGALVISGSPK